MKIAIEIEIEDVRTPAPQLRAASLLVSLAQSLRDEAYLRGQKVFKVGLGVAVGDESIKFTNITDITR